MKNLNELAVAVTELDEGIDQLNVAQTKRVVKCISKLLASDPKVVSLMLNYGIRQLETKITKKGR